MTTPIADPTDAGAIRARIGAERTIPPQGAVASEPVAPGQNASSERTADSKAS